MASRPSEVPRKPGTPEPSTPADSGESRARTVLVWLIRVEAAFMFVLAAVLAVDLVTRQRQTQIAFPLAEVGLSLLVAIALVYMARGLQHSKRWARSPAITLQLVGLPFAGRLIEFGGIRIALGVPMGLVLLTALVLLFATSSAAEYEPRPRSGGSSEKSAGPDAE